MSPTSTLRITEIFHSLQGESKTVGIPTVFVRLTGCPLRCQYCDTAYAFDGGEVMQLDAIKAVLEEYSCEYVTVTGGEPLAQPNCLSLLEQLCDAGYNVSLETSGAMPIEQVDKRVSIVMDLKTPASQEVEKNRYENIAFLKPSDQVKFVICDEKDYLWSKAKLDQYDLRAKVDEILFSPSFEEIEPAQLAEWILRDKLRIRMQMQLHKQIWGSVAGK
ncbi:MAG: 7-carboxy-7-deazaguanine synthase QueE [Gammaproteobacteria bacterium]|jgi:7-carboxy-7-deazaguanine synthase|nr:7-carboxy-7-deazaguanine synthase QueE [Gammaproteobacteria bacterium]|tara:strand:- start:94 stop:747 length:654 start_codon:yes stop_codon:yes gene_type:complete